MYLLSELSCLLPLGNKLLVQCLVFFHCFVAQAFAPLTLTFSLGPLEQLGSGILNPDWSVPSPAPLTHTA